ncbi:ABC transporter substrate-binding protein [Kiloniella sp. b19]|uniref:ABC transporter substrate-binding protein n=1 Tax=Kiloniella sp. GXU_MW_B19 TaxID=3141326 RepID=UPI0031D8DB42
MGAGQGLQALPSPASALLLKTTTAGSEGGKIESYPRRIVCLDLGSSSTLIRLGLPPVGVIDGAFWEYWVGEPELPDSVVDIGQDLVINLEAVSRLKPDLAIITSYTESHRAALEKITRVHSIPVFDGKGNPMKVSRQTTLELGELLGLEAEVQDYLAGFDRKMEKARELVARNDFAPVAMVNFMDDRHARIYGEHSMFQDVLDFIGLQNAWSGSTNYWGFQTIGLEQLAIAANAFDEMDLIVFEPMVDDVKRTMKESPLWTNLSFVKQDRFVIFPPVIAFGMLPTAERFLDLLVDYLESRYT